MRPCYTFISAKGDQPAQLSIYDEIGFWGVQAKDFRASLDAVTQSDLEVEINSPGGDYFAGLAMYNMLRSSGKTITTKVMGVAASAASVVFMAGDKRVMPGNTFLMVHNPSNGYGGTAKDHRETADMLDKIAVGARAVYSRESGMTDEDVSAMLDTNTWISAAEAVEMGLATEVTDAVNATASFDMARADLPAAVMLAFAKAETDPAEVIPPAGDAAGDDTVVDPAFADAALACAKAAGFESHAPDWALSCTTVAEVETRITNAREITALCAVTNTVAQAAALIKGNKTIVEARAFLIDMQAQDDADKPVDTTKHVSNEQSARSSAKPKVSTASIWASHNAQKRANK